MAAGYLPTSYQTRKGVETGGLVILGLLALDGALFPVWLWVLGIFLGRLPKPELRMRPTFFHFSFAYATAYSLLCLPVIFASDVRAEIVVPLHLLAMFCLGYMFYFVAKSLATVNKGRRVSGSEYGQPFGWLMMYPIGIWKIQPRINQLYAEERNECGGES